MESVANAQRRTETRLSLISRIYQALQWERPLESTTRWFNHQSHNAPFHIQTPLPYVCETGIPGLSTIRQPLAGTVQEDQRRLDKLSSWLNTVATILPGTLKHCDEPSKRPLKPLRCAENWLVYLYWRISPKARRSF